MADRISVLLQALEKRPHDPFVRYALGMEYVGQENLKEAKEYFSQVRERHPEYVPNYLQYGMLRARLGEHAEAQQIFTEGIRVAHAAGDNHAASELQAALNSLE